MRHGLYLNPDNLLLPITGVEKLSEEKLFDLEKLSKSKREI